MFLFTLCTTQAEGALLLWVKDRVDRFLLSGKIGALWTRWSSVQSIAPDSPVTDSLAAPGG